MAGCHVLGIKLLSTYFCNPQHTNTNVIIFYIYSRRINEINLNLNRTTFLIASGLTRFLCQRKHHHDQTHITKGWFQFFVIIISVAIDNWFKNFIHSTFLILTNFFMVLSRTHSNSLQCVRKKRYCLHSNEIDTESLCAIKTWYDHWLSLSVFGLKLCK